MLSSVLSSKSFIAQRPVAAPRAASQPRAVARIMTVATAKPAKAANLRTEFPTAEAIATEVERLRGEMFTARIKFAKREDYKPAQYNNLRKRIAQLLTISREREIEQGVNKREARAAEKRKLVEAGLSQF